MRLFFVIAFVVFSSGCFASCDPRPEPVPETDGGADGGPPLWADGTVELGTLASDGVTFLPLTPELELHPGAQGGFHVPIAYRVNGKSETGALFEHRLRRVKDNVLVSRGSRNFDLTNDAGPWTSWEVTVFLCPTPVGVTVEDEEVSFEVRVSRQNGVLLGLTTTRATLRCPAGNTFCQSICRG